MDAQNCRIAPYDEGKIAKPGNPVGDSDRELSFQILSASLDVVTVFGVHDSRGCKSHRILEKNVHFKNIFYPHEKVGKSDLPKNRKIIIFAGIFHKKIVKLLQAKNSMNMSRSVLGSRPHCYR